MLSPFPHYNACVYNNYKHENVDGTNVGKKKTLTNVQRLVMLLLQSWVTRILWYPVSLRCVDLLIWIYSQRNFHQVYRLSPRSHNSSGIGGIISKKSVVVESLTKSLGCLRFMSSIPDPRYAPAVSAEWKKSRADLDYAARHSR